ncbi:MAG: cytochrome c biogenesis protein CcdA [bacterium]
MRLSLRLVLLFFSIVPLAQAQPEGAPPVPIQAMLDHSAIPAGGKARLAFVFDVPKRHHITDIANGLFYVNLTDTLELHFGPPEFPKGVKFKGERTYRKTVAVFSTVSVDSHAEAGVRTFTASVGYQICQEFGNEVCFLPEEKLIPVSIEIVPSGTTVFPMKHKVFGAIEPPSGGEPEGSLESRAMSALERGSLLAFLLVFLGGILTSFTPCVYPVIPITIGYIGARSAGRPLHGLGLSAIFVLGIAIIYSTLGLLSAATGTLFGSLSGSPYVLAIVAAIFILMGLSMLGIFDMALPASWQAKLQPSGKKKGLIGPLLVGMVSGLIMAPCVGPLIVALLAWVAQTQNLLLGWALLFVYSLGLGLLFLVIGTFAGVIQALPKAGVWMEGIKKGFGWILIGAALFLLRPLLPTSVYFCLWGSLLVIFAVVSGAFEPLAEMSGTGRRLWKALAMILFLVGAMYLYRGIMPGGTPSFPEQTSISWQVNREVEVLAQAGSEGKPVLVDVYADWCVACKELDEKTYVVPDVKRRLEDFLLLKLDFTRSSPWVEQMKRKYAITGMPTVIFLDSSGEEIVRFTGFKSAGDFLALMDEHSL